MLEISRDVTDRKRAEEALRESEEKYRLLVDNAHDAIFISGDGRIQFSNPSTCRILGYTPEEMVGMPLERLIHPDDRELVMARHHARQAGPECPGQGGHRSVAVAGCCVGDAAFHEEHAAGQRARFDAEYSRLTPFCKQEHDVANRKRSKITLEYVHASISARTPES